MPRWPWCASMESLVPSPWTELCLHALSCDWAFNTMSGFVPVSILFLLLISVQRCLQLICFLPERKFLSFSSVFIFLLTVCICFLCPNLTRLLRLPHLLFLPLIPSSPDLTRNGTIISRPGIAGMQERVRGYPWNDFISAAMRMCTHHSLLCVLAVPCRFYWWPLEVMNECEFNPVSSNVSSAWHEEEG